MSKEQNQLEEQDKEVENNFFNLRNIQDSNIKLFIVSIAFLFIGIYKLNKTLRNDMIKGLFIILFIQLLDYYTFGFKIKFLKHEKYLLSLSALVGDGLYQIFIKPKIT